VSSPPIKDGGVLLNAGKIESLLDRDQVLSLTAERPALSRLDLPGSAITPGLINLHTHLDYSNMAELAHFPCSTMFDWLEELVKHSRSHLNSTEMLRQSARAGAEEAALAGTSMVVDSSFSGAAAHGIADVGIKGLVGLEIFGLNENIADMLFGLWQERMAALLAAADSTAGSALRRSLELGQLRLTIAPHAPYTVAPALWHKAIEWASERGLPVTCHLAESINESAWLEKADQRLDQYLLNVMPKNPQKEPAEALADLASMLENLTWRGKGLSPVQHLESHHLFDHWTIAAHCLHVSEEDLDILAKQRVKVAVCPRSNMLLNKQLPRTGSMLAAGLNVGFGTDSRASAPSLNILQEAAWYKEKLGQEAPDCSRLLSMLTLEAAEALGLAHEKGSLAPGKCADVAAFNLEKAGERGSSKVLNQHSVLPALFQNGGDCRLLIIDGKIIARDGRLI